MQRVSYYVATTVDGFVARPDGTWDCFLTEGDHIPDYMAALHAFDVALMGRRTYEVGAKLGVTDPYPWLETYVVSRTATSPDPKVTTISDDVAGRVRALKARPGRGVYLCGGGALAGTLLDEGLVDEITIKLNPVLIGKGVPVVSGLARDVKLALEDCKVHDCGVVVLRYRVTD